MTHTFADFGLHPHLVQTVADRGYAAPTPIQAAFIPVMLAGRDAIGQAQTGTGKTAAFALPLLHTLAPERGTIQGLVLVPTRELAMQVAGTVYAYGHALGVRVLPIYGGQSYERQISRIKKGVDVVVATPGRLLDLMGQGAVDLSAVRTVVLDEADEMLSMGFIDDLEAILAATPEDRQTAFLSATLPGGIRRLAERYMHDPQLCAVGQEQRTATGIEQRAYLVDHRDKLGALTRLLEVEPFTSVLIFAQTRVRTAELASQLTERGYAAEAINGEMSQSARGDVLDRFRRQQLQILVGTDVAARGLDIDHISHVVNYDLPRDPEVYVHRIGRTGRAGKTGVALSLVTPRERGQLRGIERYAKGPVPVAALPTREAVQAHRDARFRAQLLEHLQAERRAHARDLTLALVVEGYDPMEVAAAAMELARQPEDQRPIEPIRMVRERANGERRTGDHGHAKRANGHSAQNHRPDRSSREHESGMVRLTLDTGHANGLRPGHVVGSLATQTDIPGRAIGKIDIQERHTWVDVPEHLVEQVLARTTNYRIGRQLVSVERA